MIDPADRGFLLGDGLFETLRTEGSRPLLLGRHLARMRRSAALLGFEIDTDDLRRRAEKALARARHEGSGSLRITVSRGPGPRGLLPPPSPRSTVLITAAKAGPRTGSTVRAALSDIKRNAGSPTSAMKTLGYLDNILARMEAGEGADDAIMMNTDDHPACTTIGNLYALTSDGWVTPPASLGGILPGIVRQILLEAGAVTEAPISKHDLHLLPLARSNSLMGVQPLTLDIGAAPASDETARLTRVLEEAETSEP